MEPPDAHQENTRRKPLRIAGKVAPTEAVRTQGAADRALRRIGLNKPVPSKPAGSPSGPDSAFGPNKRLMHLSKSDLLFNQRRTHEI